MSRLFAALSLMVAPALVMEYFPSGSIPASAAQKGKARATPAEEAATAAILTDKNLKVDYKNAADLKYFITERGKIVPRRISGNCALHQREVATAIKRGRNVALLPYTVMSHQ